MERILCIGDSNTFGYDPCSPLGQRYPPEIRWTGLLRSPEREVINCGQNGRVIPPERGIAALTGLLKNRPPLDTVTVMLGTNDILQGSSAPEAASRMEALLRQLRTAAGEARLLLIAPPVLEPGNWVPDRRIAEESALLPPLYSRLAGALGIAFADAGQWGVALAFDGVHFTPEGHAAFARNLAALLRSSDRPCPDGAQRTCPVP